MKVTLIQATPNPIETISKIASICYDSDPKNPLGLVKHLYKNGHHSVFEHIYFTFKIEGISRACSHQLVRHRHCSFTQRSQRYCSEDGFNYITPIVSIQYASWRTWQASSVTTKIIKSMGHRTRMPDTFFPMLAPPRCTSRAISVNLSTLPTSGCVQERNGRYESS